MARVDNIKFHAEEWNSMLTDIVNAWAVPRAEQIADAANAHVMAEAAKVLSETPSEYLPEGDTKADAVVAAAKTKRARRNRKIANVEPPEGKRDYMVSVEGSDPLNLKDYRATVITVTERAKIDNARNNTLIRELGSNGGAQ